MKKEYTTRIFKVKHTEGVHCRESVFKYIGRSRMNGLPMYSVEIEEGEDFAWDYHLKSFVFNGKPGYTPTLEDFEFVNDLQDWLAWEKRKYVALDIVPVQAMNFPEPTGTIYHLDYVYQDRRLLLMI